MNLSESSRDINQVCYGAASGDSKETFSLDSQAKQTHKSITLSKQLKLMLIDAGGKETAVNSRVPHCTLFYARLKHTQPVLHL